MPAGCPARDPTHRALPSIRCSSDFRQRQTDTPRKCAHGEHDKLSVARAVSAELHQFARPRRRLPYACLVAGSLIAMMLGDAPRGARATTAKK